MRRLKTVRILRAIAAALLLLITGAVGGRLVGYKQASDATALLEQTAPEFLEAEQYYQDRIARKMEKIKTLPVGQEVLTDIQVLDEVYEQLRKQLLEDPNADAELLLSAMIRHQQQKLDIMEKILNRVDKYQSNESSNHEM